MPTKDEDSDKSRLEPTEIRKRELSFSFDENAENSQKKAIEDRLNALPNQKQAEQIRHFQIDKAGQIEKQDSKSQTTRETRAEALTRQAMPKLSLNLNLEGTGRPMNRQEFEALKVTMRTRVEKGDRQDLQSAREQAAKAVERYLSRAECDSGFDVGRAIAIDAAKERQQKARDDREERDK